MSSFCLHASLEALAPLGNSIVDKGNVFFSAR